MMLYKLKVSIKTVLLLVLFLLVFTKISQAQELFPIGETFKYSIKKVGVKAGEATLEFKGKTLLDGVEVLLIVFTSDGFNFYDQEMIYLDPETFYPIAVIRDINIFGKKEKIEERYDSLTSSVEITKLVGEKKKITKITKESTLDNLYCFIYRLRREKHLQIDDSFEITLPTADVRIGVDKKKEIKVMGQKYNAFYMQSVPKKYKIWFDDSESLIPLRIDGAVGFGKTSMILIDHYVGEKK